MARKSNGSHRYRLAQRVRVSRMAVLNWEADRHRPGVENMHQLAHALQVTEASIFGQEASASNKQRGALLSVSSAGSLDVHLVNDLWKNSLRAELALGRDQIATLIEEIYMLIPKPPPSPVLNDMPTGNKDVIAFGHRTSAASESQRIQPLRPRLGDLSRDIQDTIW